MHKNASSERVDALYGLGATLTERNLARGTAIAAAAAILAVTLADPPAGWQGWHYALAVVLAFDLVGGVVANGLNSAKRAHSAPADAGGWLVRLTRRPVPFAAVHVQPIVVGLVFPGAHWWWGPLWWATTLAAVVVVARVPLHLKRPTALLAAATVAVAAPLVPTPAGFWWVPVILVLKLVVAHAVPEEAYRPPARSSSAVVRGSRGG